jgi:hypothetical protein
MIEGLTATPGGLHRNPQHLLEFALADVVGETAGAEGIVAGAILAGIRCVLRPNLGIGQPRARGRALAEGAGAVDGPRGPRSSMAGWQPKFWESASKKPIFENRLLEIGF